LSRRPAKNLVSLQILEEIRLKILAVFGKMNGEFLSMMGHREKPNDVKLSLRLLGSCGFARFLVVLGGVETKNVLSLSRAGVDRAQVLTSLHFPDCRDYSIFLDCVVRDLFGARLGRRIVVGRGVDCAFILRHTNSKILQSACGRFLMCGELLHTLVTSVQPLLDMIYRMGKIYMSIR
jgi:hypothetical protein